MKSIKHQAKEMRAKRLSSLGGASREKTLDVAPGHTWDGEDGLNSGQVYQKQKIPTRKTGGRVEGEKARSRMDRVPRASGGRTKGKTNITVIVGPQGAQQPQPPQKIPVPVPLPQGAPPTLPAQGAAPPPMSPAGPMGMPPSPMMPRKRGGRVPMSAGAGSGEGRLEKTERQKRVS